MLEKQEDVSISSTVKKTYDNVIDGLQTSLQNLESDFRKNDVICQREYYEQKEKLNERRKQAYQVYKKQREDITVKYNSSQLQLASEAKERVAPYALKIAEVLQRTMAQLSNNLERHRGLYEHKMQEITNFLAEMQIKIESLRNLHMEFKA
jgi:hypothetical protein